MIKCVSEKILNFMCKNYDIPSNMKEIYQYGVEITISSIFNILLIIIASLVIGDFISGVIFLVCFIFLRSYCGGYHATTYFRCNIVFLVTYVSVEVASILLSEVFPPDLWIAEVIILLAFLPVLIYAPVKNKHKTLEKRKILKCKMFSAIIYIIAAFLALFLYSHKSIYGMTIIMTLMSIAVMILIEIFMQRRGYHEV